MVTDFSTKDKVAVSNFVAFWYIVAHIQNMLLKTVVVFRIGFGNFYWPV